MVLRLVTAVGLSFLCGVVPCPRAERILLKNGKIINGSVVGYEGEMFRLKTDYGFALIRRDSVESITFDSSEAAASTKKEPEQSRTRKKASSSVSPFPKPADATASRQKSPKKAAPETASAKPASSKEVVAKAKKGS